MYNDEIANFGPAVRETEAEKRFRRFENAAFSRHGIGVRLKKESPAGPQEQPHLICPSDR